MVYKDAQTAITAPICAFIKATFPEVDSIPKKVPISSSREYQRKTSNVLIQPLLQWLFNKTSRSSKSSRRFKIDCL